MGRIKDAINSPIENLIRQRGINKAQLMSDYKNGMGSGHLRIKYRISQEILTKIIKENTNSNIENKRKESIEKVKIIYTPLPEKKAKNAENISLADAIKRVEKGEER